MSVIHDKTTEKQHWQFLIKAALFMARYRRLIQFSGFAILLCFAGYSYWNYGRELKKRTAVKVDDAGMITDYIQSETMRVMGSGKFHKLEGAFHKIRELSREKGIEIDIYRSNGTKAFSDNQTANHVLALAIEVSEYFQKTIADIPVSKIKTQAKEILARGRPEKTSPFFDNPALYHDKIWFDKALMIGESSDIDHDYIEKFIRIDRDECGDACHSGENAVIKMKIDKRNIERTLALELEWEMAKAVAFVAGLLLFIGLFGKLDEINRHEREVAREKHIGEIKESYGKLQNLMRELSRKNDEISKYATEMEKLVEERTEQLVHADRMTTLGIMSSGIVHEVNNPTSYIRTNANILSLFWDQHLKKALRKVIEERTGDHEKLIRVLNETPKLIRSIEEGTGRIEKIVDGLKKFYRQEEPVFKLENISNCIENAVEFSRFDMALKNKVKMELDLPGDIPDIMLNKQEIEQVLINLFANAAYAMEGIQDAIISVSVEHTKNDIIVAVTDNGKGMNKETIKKIFTPFFTTKSKSGGSGLGLPVSYGIIERHGGKMKVKSSPGKGTTFTITLPK